MYPSSRDDQTTATPTSVTSLLSTSFPLIFDSLIYQINLPQWPYKRLFSLCVFSSIPSDLYRYLGSTSVKLLRRDRASTRVLFSGYEPRPLIYTSTATTERRLPDMCKSYQEVWETIVNLSRAEKYHYVSNHQTTSLDSIASKATFNKLLWQGLNKENGVLAITREVNGETAVAHACA